MKSIQDIFQPKNRWQKEINSDEWRNRKRDYLRNNPVGYCPGCRQSKPLHVHHINYDTDKHLWEYDDNDLIAICAECHGRYHQLFKLSRELFVKIPPAKLSELIGCLGASLKANGAEGTVNLFRRLLENAN